MWSQWGLPRNSPKYERSLEQTCASYLRLKTRWTTITKTGLLMAFFRSETELWALSHFKAAPKKNKAQGKEKLKHASLEQPYPLITFIPTSIPEYIQQSTGWRNSRARKSLYGGTVESSIQQLRPLHLSSQVTVLKRWYLSSLTANHWIAGEISVTNRRKPCHRSLAGDGLIEWEV